MGRSAGRRRAQLESFRNGAPVTTVAAVTPTAPVQKGKPAPRTEPSQDDEGRSLLQSRLATVLVVLGGISLFYSLSAITVAFIGGKETAPLRVAFATLGAGVIIGALALRYRSGKRSLTELRWVDGATTAFACWISAANLTQVRPASEASVSLLLSVTWVLVARTVLLPSSGRRTLAICLLALVPSGAVASWLRVQDLGHAPDVSDWVSAAYVSYRGIAITALLATLASSVIYGLRRRVSAIARVGQYMLHEKLGQGGMGVVYRATHALLRRATAVKLLLPSRISAASIARFEREVTLTAQLTHPNTVAIFDYGRTPEGVFYYAMEYLEGGDLEKAVSFEAALPAGRVIWILSQVCGALAEAHELGLVHRDIKPSNVILCERGREGDVAKLLDFGLVKDLNDADGGMTHDETITGTPLYMSPESLRSPDEVGPRSDLYSLGAVAYFLLTGSPPFTGNTIVEICAAHLYSAPEPLSQRRDGIPADLEAVVLRCLDKDASARFQTALELRAALSRCVDAASWDGQRAADWWSHHRVAFQAHCAARRDKQIAATQIGDAATEPSSALQIDLDRRMRLPSKGPGMLSGR